MAIGFMIAAFLCSRSKNHGIMVFYLFATIETFTKYRYPFHVWARDVLLDTTPQNVTKEVIQLTLMLLCAAAAVGILIWLIQIMRRNDRPRMLLLAGVTGTLCMCAVELISPHNIDAIIYKIDWILVRSGWIYFLMAGLSSAGAVLARRQIS